MISESEMKFEPKLRAHSFLDQLFPGCSMGESFHTDSCFKIEGGILILETKKKKSKIQIPLSQKEIFSALIQGIAYVTKNNLVNVKLIVIVDWFNWYLFNYFDVEHYVKFPGADWNHPAHKCAEFNKNMLNHMMHNTNIKITQFSWEEKSDLEDFLTAFYDKNDQIFTLSESKFMPFGKVFIKYKKIRTGFFATTILAGSWCSNFTEDLLYDKKTILEERKILFTAGKLVWMNDEFSIFKVSVDGTSPSWAFRLATGNQMRDKITHFKTLDGKHSMIEFYDLPIDESTNRLQVAKKIKRIINKQGLIEWGEISCAD